MVKHSPSSCTDPGFESVQRGGCNRSTEIRRKSNGSRLYSGDVFDIARLRDKQGLFARLGDSRVVKVIYSVYIVYMIYIVFIV